MDEEIDFLEENNLFGKNDLLDSESYVNLLIDCVNNAPSDKTFNVGLIGEWGSGKSSIIKTFKHQIESQCNKKIKVIVYDAWKYSHDSFRRMFLLQLQKDLKLERQSLLDKFYINTTDDLEIKSKFNWIYPTSIGIVCLLVFLVWGEQSLDCKVNLVALISFLAFASTVIKGSFQDFKVVTHKPYMFAPEQFEECFKEICDKALNKSNCFKTLFRYIRGDKGEQGFCRLVIVIDNIDRCTSEQVNEFFTCIKTFLDIDKNVIFVIPVDEKAVINHFKKFLNNSASETSEFLRKFFNVCIRLKSFKRFDMFDFANMLNIKHGAELNPTSVSLIANEFAHNPRRIIQLFNNLNMTLSALDCKYGEFSKKHQSLVCFLQIVQEEYPYFYNLLLDDPSLEKAVNTLDLHINQDHEKIKLKEIHAFIHRNIAVIKPYFSDSLSVEKIISHKLVEDKLPEHVIQGFNSLSDIDSEKKSWTCEFEKSISDNNIRQQLVLYIEQKLRQAINRELLQTDVKHYIDNLLLLNKRHPFTFHENSVFVGLFVSEGHFKSIVDNQENLHNLIFYAALLEKQNLRSIAEGVVDYISELNDAEVGKSILIDDLWFACSMLSEKLLEKITKQIAIAFKQDLKAPFKYEYSFENAAVVFSEEVIEHTISQISLGDEDAEDCIVQIAKLKKGLTEWQLYGAVKAINSKTQRFIVNPSNYSSIEKKIKSVSALLEYCEKLKLEIRVNEFYNVMIEFANKFTPSSMGNINEAQEFLYVNNNKAEIIDLFLSFFKYASLLTRGKIVSDRAFGIILNNQDNCIKFVATLVFLNDKGYPVENYIGSLLKIAPLDDTQVSLLNSLIQKKSADNSYLIDNKNIEKYLCKLLDECKSNKNSLCIESVQSLFHDDHIKQQLSKILTTKYKSCLNEFPYEILEFAIDYLEKHFDDFKNDNIILCSLAAKGSDAVKTMIALLVNSWISEQNSFEKCLEVIKSFTSLPCQTVDTLRNTLLLCEESAPHLKESIKKCLEYVDNISKS